MVVPQMALPMVIQTMTFAAIRTAELVKKTAPAVAITKPVCLIEMGALAPMNAAPMIELAIIRAIQGKTFAALKTKYARTRSLKPAAIRTAQTRASLTAANSMIVGQSVREHAKMAFNVWKSVPKTMNADVLIHW